jgi:hypothetical protein
MKVYVPVSISTLPEYLSSGFVGLTASLEPDKDRQSEAFPDFFALREPLIPKTHVLLEIEAGQDADVGETEGLNLMTGVLPISRVQQILFGDEVALKDFSATYSMMPDIPLEHFKLDVLPQGDFNLTGDSPGVTPPKFKRRNLREDPARVASTLIGVREAIEVAGGRLTNFKSFEITKVSSRKLSLRVIEELLDAVGHRHDTKTSSLELLKVYFDAIEKIGTDKKVEPGKLQMTMQEKLDEYQSGGKMTDEDHRLLSGVMEKTRLIMLGVDSESFRSDDPTLTLQRGICLACIANGLDAFDAIRQNSSIGPIVESIARLLVANRMRVGRIAGSVWREKREDMDKVLETACSIVNKDAFKLDFNCSPLKKDFSHRQQLKLCDDKFLDKNVQASHQIRHVVSVLQTCGFDPLPDEQSNIVVQFYPGKGERPTPVKLMLKSGPTASHRHNVQISVPWPAGEAKLAKKAERSKVLNIAARCMVSIMRGSVDGELILSRHQLLDTMDKDELSYHVELVALASRELAAEFGV